MALPANVLGFYLIATRMTAAIAKVRGYDLRQEEIRTAVLLTLVGADADDLLKKAGMASPGGTLSNLAAQRLPGPAMMVIQKGVGFRLLATAGKNMFVRLGKIVPIVGGVIGAGLDGFMQHRVSASAKREFPTARPAVAATDHHGAGRLRLREPESAPTRRSLWTSGPQVPEPAQEEPHVKERPHRVGRRRRPRGPDGGAPRWPVDRGASRRRASHGPGDVQR